MPEADVSFLLKVFQDYCEDFQAPADIIIQELDKADQQALPKKFKPPLWNVCGDSIVLVDKYGKACWVDTSKAPFVVKLQAGFAGGEFVYNILEPLFVILSYLRMDFNYIPFHGSSFITREGRTVMVVSDSGFGKTSVLLHHVLNENGSYISDELTFLDTKGAVLPYTRQIFLYRRNFINFQKLYSLLPNKILKLQHLAVSALFSFLDLLPASRLGRKVRTNFFLNMCPVLVHPGVLGNLVSRRHQHVDDIVFITRREDAEKDPQVLLKESFIVFLFERYFFYMGAQLHDMQNGKDLLAQCLSSYSERINLLLPSIRFHKVIADDASSLQELNSTINRVVHQVANGKKS